MKTQHLILILIASFTLLSCRQMVIIDRDEAILVLNYKKENSRILEEGMHKIPKGTKVIKYNLRDQKESVTLDFLFNNEESGAIEYTLFYSLKPESLEELYYTYGENYIDRLLKPVMRSTARATLQNMDEYEANIETAESAITSNILMNADISPFIEVKAVFVHNMSSDRITNKIKENDLEADCEKLKSSKPEERIEAIKNIANCKKPFAYEIILKHWNVEKDENVKSFIIELLMK